MAKINFKKVLSFLMALCMIMSLFTCVSILPASAATGDNMFYISQGNRLVEFASKAGLEAGKRYTFTCKMKYETDISFSAINELFIHFWYGTSSGIARLNNSATPSCNFEESYDASTYTYTASFTIPTDAKSSENFMFKFGDFEQAHGGANFKLWIADFTVTCDGSEVAVCPEISEANTHVSTSRSYDDMYRVTSTAMKYGTDIQILDKGNTFPDATEEPEVPASDKMFYIAKGNRLVEFASKAGLEAGKRYTFTCKMKYETDISFSAINDLFIHFWYGTSSGIARLNNSATPSCNFEESYNASTCTYTASFTIPTDAKSSENFMFKFGEFEQAYDGKALNLYIADFKMFCDGAEVDVFPEISEENTHISTTRAYDDMYRVPSTNMKYGTDIKILDKGDTFPEETDEPEEPEVPGEPDSYDDGAAKLVRFVAGKASYLHYYNENRTLAAGEYELGFDWNTLYGDGAYVKLMVGGEVVLENTFGAEYGELLTENDYFAEDLYNPDTGKREIYFELEEDTTGIEIVVGASNGTTSMYIANAYIKALDSNSNVIGNNLINNITESTYYASGLGETNNKMWNRESGSNGTEAKSVLLLNYNADAFNGAELARRLSWKNEDWVRLEYNDYYDAGIKAGTTYRLELDYRQFTEEEFNVLVYLDGSSVSGTKEIDEVNRKYYLTFTAAADADKIMIRIGNYDNGGASAAIGHVSLKALDAEGNATGNSLIDDINILTSDLSTTTAYDRVWIRKGTSTSIQKDNIPAGYFSANTAADKMVYFPEGHVNWHFLAYKDTNVFLPAGTYQLKIDAKIFVGTPTVKLLTGSTISEEYSATSVTNDGNKYTYTFELGSNAWGVGIMLGNRTDNYVSAMFKCPALYRVVDGEIASKNYIEPINNNTVVTRTEPNDRASASNARWTTFNYASANTKILDIDEQYFEGDVVTTGTPYMAIFTQGKAWTALEYNDECLTLVKDKTYTLTIDERDVTGTPTFRINGNGRNISSLSSNYTDVKNGTTRTITFTMNESVTGVKIYVGNYEDGSPIDISAKYANVKLVESGSDTNLIAGFSSDTFASSAENRKWRKAGQSSSGNISTFYTSAIPEGYFENELTDKMFYISEVTTNASYGNTIIRTGATVAAGKTYTVELDWKAHAGFDPDLRITYKNTSNEWKSIAVDDFSGDLGHYTATITMPEDTVTDSIFNIEIGLGAKIKDDDYFNYGRGSVYFGNFSLKESGSDANLLVNSDLNFANEGDFSNTIAWNVIGKNNGSRDMYNELKVLEQPENFFTEEGAAAKKQVKFNGGDYDYIRQNLVLESNTTYRLSYKYLFVNAPSTQYMQQIDANSEFHTISYTYSEFDKATRTKIMEFTTMDGLRERKNNAVISFLIENHGSDVKFNFADVKLYKVVDGEVVGGNLINNGGFFFGDDITLDDEIKSEVKDERSTNTVQLLGWTIYGTFAENQSIEVATMDENSFAAVVPTFAERLVNITKILLKVITNSDSLFADLTGDGKVDVRDLVRSKELAAENYVPNGSEDEVNAWKKENLSGSNATDISGITGTIYYVDAVNGSDSNDGTTPETAWKSLFKVRSASSGDAVLFKAGQTWRPSSNGSTDVLSTESGVTYGAYGDGAKPQILGSAYNYATRTWEKVSDNVWRTNVGSESAGIVVYNGGELIGTMTKTRADLATANIGDFCHWEVVDNVIDETDNYIYVNCPVNPAEYWTDIEIGVYKSVISLSSNVTIDNIAVMYTGYHGMDSGAGVKNITISNCVISYIGGSYNDKNRLGNGIQFGISGENLTVENCYVSECYDAGLTFQTWESINGNGYWTDLSFTNNLVENCEYAFEWFAMENTPITNIDISNNIFRGAGYGWSYDERIGYGEDLGQHQVSLLRVGANGYYSDIENFQFNNNILDSSKRNLVYWWWNASDVAEGDMKEITGFTASGNSFYQTKNADNIIIQYINEGGHYGVGSNAILDALKLFENTDAPTGVAEVVITDNTIVFEK